MIKLLLANRVNVYMPQEFEKKIFQIISFWKPKQNTEATNQLLECYFSMY